MRRWPWSESRAARRRLIVMARFPEPGRAKTRLIPHLGAERAARLHDELLRHTLAWADDLARLCDVEVEVHFAGGDSDAMLRAYGPRFEYRPQSEGDLGRRMLDASQAAFRSGVERVVIVGADCPGLSAELAAAALRALDAHDVVLGPARDGGYYLIGLSRPTPELFADIDWGTERVFAQTLDAAGRASLSVARLVELDDVDRVEDLPIWERARDATNKPIAAARLSIVIPTLNEAAHLGATLDAVSAALVTPDQAETIVADGGSDDATVDIALGHGATIVRPQRGRAAQMNTGAAAAAGDILLFLHADTLVPHGFDAAIRQTLADRDVLLGAFSLGIDGPGTGLRLVERIANRRSRIRQFPYGDQGLFLRASVFRTVGGFPMLPIMEDFALVDYLRRRGRVATLDAAVRTSPRRWRRLGVVRTTLVNQAMIVGYRLGVSPERLTAWYRGRGRT